MTSVNLSHRYFKAKCPQRSNVPIATKRRSRQTTHRISLYILLRTRALHWQRNYITSFNQRRSRAKMHSGARHAKNPAGQRKHSPTSNRPLEKTNPGKENPEPHSLRYDFRNGALYGSRTRIIPKNGTDRHYLTPGDRKTRAPCRNNKKRERMDITQRRHNNPDNTNTPTPITGIRIDV